MSESCSFQVPSPEDLRDEPLSEGVMIHPRKTTNTYLRPYIRSFTLQELKKCCKIQNWSWAFLSPLHISLRIDVDFAVKIEPLFNNEECVLLHPLMGPGSNYDRCLRAVIAGSKSGAAFGMVRRASIDGTKDRLIGLCDTVDDIPKPAADSGRKNSVSLRHNERRGVGRSAVQFLNALARYLCTDVLNLGRRQSDYTIEHDSEPDECVFSFRGISREFQPPGAVYITANEGDEIFVETHDILTFFTPIFKPVDTTSIKQYYAPTYTDCHLDCSQEAGCLIALAQQYFQKQQDRFHGQTASPSLSRSSSPYDWPQSSSRQPSKLRLDCKKNQQQQRQLPTTYQPYIISTRGDHIVCIITATITKGYLDSIEEGLIQAGQGIELQCSKLYDLRDFSQRYHFTELLVELLTVLVRRWSISEVDPLPEKPLTSKQAARIKMINITKQKDGKIDKGKSKSGKKTRKRSSNPCSKPITNCL